MRRRRRNGSECPLSSKRPCPVDTRGLVCRNLVPEEVRGGVIGGQVGCQEGKNMLLFFRVFRDFVGVLLSVFWCFFDFFACRNLRAVSRLG